MVELRTVIPEEIDRYLDSLVGAGPFNNKAELVRAALASYTSMAGPMAQIFDKENIFSPDGRIYQTEYARESALRASPSIGIVYDGGVVLVARMSTSPPVLWYPRLQRVSNEIAVSMTGLIADGCVTVQRIKKTHPKALDDLIDELTMWFWDNTSQRGRRPLGVFLMVATTLGDEPKLFLFEPSGACVEGKAFAIGKGYKRIQAILNIDSRIRTAKEAEALASEALGKAEKWERNDIMHLKHH